MRSISSAVLVAMLVAATARSETFDETLYAAILGEFTRPVNDVAGVRVDYAGLARANAWKRLMANVEQTDPRTLSSRAERLAYWINVYNVLAIDTVVRHYPVDSIRDVGSFWNPVWKHPASRIAGRAVSLHHVEHEILRPLGDPRIHAAIVCASTSCPTLRRDPYRASTIDAQLDEAMRRFLADRDKGLRIERSDATLHLSRIFDWFSEDFAGGGGVIPSVTAYLSGDDRVWMENHGSLADVEYLDYDWNLNGQPRPGRRAR
jgi:hypothetical protein